LLEGGKIEGSWGPENMLVIAGVKEETEDEGREKKGYGIIGITTQKKM